MRKKIVAFIAALTICAGVGGAAVYNTKISTRDKASISAAAKDNPNISADYVDAPLFDDTREKFPLHYLV